MIKNKEGIYQFSSFLAFPELVHGFSTTEFGDMRPSKDGGGESFVAFTSALEINLAQVIRMKQVHSRHVEQVAVYDVGATIADTDGLVTDARNLFLSVMTADCIPLLLFDRYKKNIGVVHAGWRGLYSEIITEAIEKMKHMGSNPIDILVGIGPCIRSCCYTIDQERVLLFRNKFEPKHGKPLGYIVTIDNEIRLNLPYLAKIQLHEMGILAEHIEDSELCTFHTPDLYSYRREGKSFGELLGIIGRL